LGSVTFSNGNLVTGGGVAPVGGPAIVASQSSTHFNGNIVRVGLNYKFDWGKGKAPVVARY